MADWPYNTAQWKRLRLRKLQDSPLCEYCPPGRQRPATQVDHVTPIADGGDPWDMANLASCCGPCHSAKTARGLEAGAVRSRKPRRGCNPDGTPLDRRHWWNQKISGS